MNKVAVTGLGAICGLGHHVDEIWKNLIDGKNGISTIENFSTQLLPINLAGEVKNFTISEELLPAREAPRYDLFVHYALHASSMAYQSSMANSSAPKYDPYRMGCILGVGIGGFPLIESTHGVFLEKGYKRVNPFFIPGIIPNMAAGLTSIRFGFKGVNYTSCSACASSLHAIGNACMEIQLGTHDYIIAGGAEAVLGNLSISGFAAMKALSKNPDPQKASSPFNITRDGFVMAEGAGVLALENYELAKARGAHIYATIEGFSSTSDAYHITSPDPQGSGASKCMELTLKNAKVKPEQVNYINAHATSTSLGDAAEIQAIKRVFGESQNLYISSTKASTGHLLGAAGGIESVFCIKAINDSIVPPTRNLDQLDPECFYPTLSSSCAKTTIEYALNNSFGFGGTNSSILFKKP